MDWVQQLAVKAVVDRSIFAWNRTGNVHATSWFPSSGFYANVAMRVLYQNIKLRTFGPRSRAVHSRSVTAFFCKPHRTDFWILIQ